MNPRAWIVTKQGMTGDLYEALAWDNGGKPLGVSCTQPIPLYEAMPASHKPTYDDAAIRDDSIQSRSDPPRTGSMGRHEIERSHAVMHIARNGVDESIRLGRQVDELAMLVARLARSLKFASPGSDLAGQAMDYLRRNNLQGAIMRAPTPSLMRACLSRSGPTS